MIELSVGGHFVSVSFFLWRQREDANGRLVKIFEYLLSKARAHLSGKLTPGLVCLPYNALTADIFTPKDGNINIVPSQGQMQLFINHHSSVIGRFRIIRVTTLQAIQLRFCIH